MEVFNFENNVFTITEITNQIKKNLENNFFNISVEGEVSNFRPSSSGHYYFSLKDSSSILNSCLFKNRLNYLNFTIEDGKKVKATGFISVYPPKGSYQLIIEKIEETGTGNIKKILDDRKKKYAGMGYFDIDKKKSIPSMPKIIGVVSSPTGAALQDIINIINRRNGGIKLIIFPTLVQGENAGKMIAKQIDTANRYNLCEVLIIGRGGGSLEDLMPFSDEKVIEAIYNSNIPIISAVGHEIDFMLSDFVADLRAPTPSAAAELVTQKRSRLLDKVVDIKQSLIISVTRNIDLKKEILQRFSKENLIKSLKSTYIPAKLKSDELKNLIVKNFSGRIEKLSYRVDFLKSSINKESPFYILEKGYAIVENSDKKIIKSASLCGKDEKVTIKFFDGSKKAVIE